MLLPTGQCGSGTASGCDELVARHLQTVYDSDPRYVLIQMDIRNAFNEVGRKHILAGLLNLYPKLARWFLWSYGSPSRFRLHDGSLGPILNQTGCRQGDPLSGLLFCVGFHAGLVKIK
jgi:hypothetical protein